MGVEIKLERSFLKQAKGVYEKYEFEVGILIDSAHKEALPASSGLSSYAGGPIRKTSGKQSGKTVSEVSEDLREKVGNFYTAPFSSKNNADILKFVKSFFDLCAGRTEPKRCENLLQAIVRNPILRGDYGSNSDATRKKKGFNRFMIDTSQLFKSITAKVRVSRVSS